MPVTAKLSRHFYDQLGDDVANELVNWFNAVDETYRNQLRELNELNWERFRSELRAEGATIRSEMEKRFAAVDVRFSALDSRFTTLEERLDARFARQNVMLLKWMFGFWTASAVSTAALVVALANVLR